MRVLITTDWYKPVINGVVASVCSLARGLEELGADVRILTLSGSMHSYKSGRITYIGSIGVGKIYPQARAKAVPGGKLVEELISWRPDIVHSQCEFSTFPVAREIAHRCGCPLAHTYHTVYEDFTHYFSLSTKLGKRMAEKFTRWICARTDAVIAPTEKVRMLFSGYGIQTPTVVIPTGLELEAFAANRGKNKNEVLLRQLGISSDEQILLYVGRLALEKNVEELLRLFAEQNAPKRRLVLVGDGPDRTRLEEYAKELNLGNRAVFAGMVPHERIADYYALGDLFVSASQSETQGLTYIEAMAAGLPLLCRRDSCLKDVLRDEENGFCYDDGDDFLQKLQILFEDEKLRKTMGEQSRLNAFRQFSSKAFAQAVLSEYKNLLKMRNCKSIA